MTMTLLGFKTLDFIADNGSVIKGTQLFTSSEEDGVTGLMVDKLFIREGMELPTLTPGMKLDISFSRRGKVVAVKVATTPAKV